MKVILLLTSHYPRETFHSIDGDFCSKTQIRRWKLKTKKMLIEQVHILGGTSGCSEFLWCSGYPSTSFIDIKEWPADVNLTNVQLRAMEEREVQCWYPGFQWTARDGFSLCMIREVSSHGRVWTTILVPWWVLPAPMEDQWTLLSLFILLVDQQKYRLGSENTTGQSPNQNLLCNYYSLRESNLEKQEKVWRNLNLWERSALRHRLQMQRLCNIGTFTCICMLWFLFRSQGLFMSSTSASSSSLISPLDSKCIQHFFFFSVDLEKITYSLFVGGGTKSFPGNTRKCLVS